MEIGFTRLAEVAPADIVALHADPRVRRHLPLAGDDFDEAACLRWIADKEGQWTRNGFGPWAIRIDGRFAGWGGLQLEDGDVDLALVLSPPYWGHGRAICREILNFAFGELGLPSVTVLLPASRVRSGGLGRLGFRPDRSVLVSGIRFDRYRLSSPDRSDAHSREASTA